MNRIKFYLNEGRDYPIEKTLFEEKTQKSKRFYRKNAADEINQYAICPACNGPVQIIGLYKRLANTEHPYGKHVNHTLSGLAQYYQENYDFCPYRAKRETYDKDTRKANLNPLSLAIIQKLIRHFDRVIYLISKYTGIYISDSLAKNMLNDYFDSQAYLYPGSTLINIPFMLAYFMRANTLFYRKLNLHSPLAQALAKQQAITFKQNQVVNATKSYQKCEFYFIKHIPKLEQHALTETLVFEVVLSGEVIYHEQLVFNPDYSENLMNFDASSLSENIKQHNKTLLEMARSVAEEKGFKVDEMESA